MSEIITIDGIDYTKSNKRMRYNSEFHENHGNPFSKDDLIYMCSMWDSMKKADIAMALGKTHGTVLSKAYKLRKNGLFDYYRSLGQTCR
ncbi:hypothetical protein NE686_17885 [Tissierella carlieri]|uniref:Uncharacterized protein n=1 Tax=Tissierella carlieri TaxID=689904 RepID=A0ABT1SEU5_9FIRM|nr:hypothetical protein [Tissierella carlieri]MCQ4924976.1 hypothetical protein [Tissierella carlieri]